MSEDDLPPPDPNAAIMAEAMATLGSALAPILEACVGYRTQCEGLGFGKEAADRMAADFHRMLTGVVGKNMGAAT